MRRKTVNAATDRFFSAVLEFSRMFRTRSALFDLLQCPLIKRDISFPLFLFFFLLYNTYSPLLPEVSSGERRAPSSPPTTLTLFAISLLSLSLSFRRPPWRTTVTLLYRADPAAVQTVAIIRIVWMRYVQGDASTLKRGTGAVTRSMF